MRLFKVNKLFLLNKKCKQHPDSTHSSWFLIGPWGLQLNPTHCLVDYHTIRKPCTVNQRVLHSFIYALSQSWRGLCSQDSHGYETCKVHLLPQQQRSWSGLSQTHMHRESQSRTKYLVLWPSLWLSNMLHSDFHRVHHTGYGKRWSD